MGMYNSWQDYYERGIIPNIWKGITGQTSADRNADKNLEYQQERNAIEDARYEDETSYNRAFAEEERDYNRSFALEEQNYNRNFQEEARDYERALQNLIFEREDTAITRQAQELSKLGINPLSQNLNGLGSGSVVSASGNSINSAPGSLNPPALSGRGGTALNRQMQKFGTIGEFLGSFESILRPLQDINQSIRDYKTGNLQRDALALENDKQFLENFKQAHDLGIDYSSTFLPSTSTKNYRNTNLNFFNKEGKNIFDTKEYQGTAYNGYFEGRAKDFNTFSRGGFDSILERSLTKGSELLDNALNKFSTESIYDLGNKNGKFNFFDFLKSILNF